MAPAFGQRDREKESVDNYDVHVCLVKVCDNRVTKYVSIQTRERPGPARGKMVVRSQYVCLVKMCVTIASTKYVSFQTRARPGSARRKLVGCSQLLYVCLVKVCVTIASTKYVSFQTRERPGPARAKNARDEVCQHVQTVI